MCFHQTRNPCDLVKQTQFVARPPWPVSYFCQGALDGKLEDFKLKKSDATSKTESNFQLVAESFSKFCIWFLFFGLILPEFLELI